MCMGMNIKQFIQGKVQTLLTFGFVLMLCSCGGDSCPTVQEAGAPCVLCDFFDVLTVSASSIANSAWDRLARPMGDVVIVVAAIYIALYTLQSVSSFGKQTLADYFSGDKRGLFILMFKAALIFALLDSIHLAGKNEFLEKIIGPLLFAGMEIGNTLASATATEARSYIAADVSWDSIFGMLNQSARDFNNSVYIIVGLGEAMACNAVDGWPWEWEFLQLIYGCIVFIFGWMLLIGVCFYLIDIIIHLSFAAVLLPLGIACAISNLSMPYTKNIWNMFINVFFNLIMLGIVVGLVIQIVFHCLGGGADFDIDPSLHSYSYDMQDAMDANRIAELSAAMVTFGGLLLTIVCFAIMVEVIAQMGSLASEISDTATATGNAAQQAVAPAANAAKNTVTSAGKWTGNLAWSGAKQVGHDVARATRLDKLYKWTGGKAQAARGFFTGSGAQGYNAFWHKQTLNKIGKEITGFATDSRSDKFKRLWRWIK